MEEMNNNTKENSTATEIENRKKNLISFFKKKGDWIVYAILAVIISISIYIRTLPMKISSATGKPGLWDITTNNWTLGPDLDPFLFLRWAKEIVANGKLFLLDALRYVPLAHICSGVTCDPVNTSNDMQLLSYMIAGLYKFLAIFSKDVTVTYAAIIFPVLMAVLTGFAFFLFARKLFYKEDKKIANIIALVSTAFFVLIPSLLPRSIAGIPEKESAAFFFIFIGFYFFLEAFTSDKWKRGLIFGVLAGISTGILGLVWGGSEYFLLTISGAVLLFFLFGRIDKKRFWFFTLWLASSLLVMMPFSDRYSLENIIFSTSTGLVLITFFILALDFLLFKKKVFRIGEKITKKIKLPEPVISLLVAILLGIVLSFIFLGGSFLTGIAKDVISSTVNPISLNRFSVTVAENQQPYFISDWVNNFGPTISNIPVYFWLFFIGSVFLFSYLIKFLGKKEKRLLVFSYVLFLICLIFSKYSSTSILNGVSTLSLLVYFGGALLFIGSFGYVCYKRYKANEFSIFNELDFMYLFYFVAITLAIISARGAVRLVLVLGAVSPIVIGFLIVKSIQNYFKEKEDIKKLIVGIFVLLLIASSIFTIWVYYQSDKSMAESYIPSQYTQQWQKAMSWVRENTPLTAVFAHWWDYGYWVQSIGERATIVDGGNAIGYWNYLVGRKVLTTTNERDALDVLYAHNGTNLLIDSTDIGKYPAFSSIGSDANYDRYSWIPTVVMDDTQTKETNNQTMNVYPIGVYLDQDLLLNESGKEILLPRQKAAAVAIMTATDLQNHTLQPIIFFSYNGQQYQEPLRYIYINGKLYDFKSGADMGIYIYPRLDPMTTGGVKIVPNGAAFYLSARTINSELVRLYLFDEQSNYFKLTHTEENPIVEILKAQGMNLGSFVYYQGFLGPIKIWDVKYPSDIKVNSDYLRIDYPDLSVTTIKSGEY